MENKIILNPIRHDVVRAIHKCLINDREKNIWSLWDKNVSIDTGISYQADKLSNLTLDILLSIEEITGHLGEEIEILRDQESL